MNALKPKGYLRFIAGFTTLLGALAPASPAFAQFAVPDFDLTALPDFNALLNDPLAYPWILAAGGALLLVLLTGGFLIYRRWRGPGKSAADRKHRKFWKALPASHDGYKGVLYRNEMLAAQSAVDSSIPHHIEVVLQHENPEHSKVLFRNEEQPNVLDMDTVSEAMAVWIDTARQEGLPAVYATRDGIHVLEQPYFAEMEDDPDSFARKFVSYLMRKKPLPAV